MSRAISPSVAHQHPFDGGARFVAGMPREIAGQPGF